MCIENCGSIELHGCDRTVATGYNNVRDINAWRAARSTDIDDDKFETKKWQRHGKRLVLASAMVSGSLGLLGTSQSAAMEPPANDSPQPEPCIDTDGDGWGWDGSASCPMPAQFEIREPIEQKWENSKYLGPLFKDQQQQQQQQQHDERSEWIEEAHIQAAEAAETKTEESEYRIVGTDGLEHVTANQDQPPVASDPICIDTDGDGWGWDGDASCPMSEQGPSQPEREAENLPASSNLNAFNADVEMEHPQPGSVRPYELVDYTGLPDACRTGIKPGWCSRGWPENEFEMLGPDRRVVGDLDDPWSENPPHEFNSSHFGGDSHPVEFVSSVKDGYRDRVAAGCRDAFGGEFRSSDGACVVGAVEIFF